MKYLNKTATAVCFGVLITACQSTQPSDKEAFATPAGYCLPAELAKNLKLADVMPATEHNRVQLTGKVMSNPEKYYRFVPLLEGVVSKVNFSLGDYVKKGTVLLEVRSPELSRLNAELRTTQAQLKLAQRQRSATQEMYDDGVASERELIAAQQDVEMAELAITKVQENLSIYGGSLERGVLIVKAPLSGHIVSKNIVSGQQIEAGDAPLFSISNLEEVWILANVYTGNLSSVKEGMAVEVKTFAYADEVFKGKIDRLANTFDTDERVLKARISIQNRDLLLKPEMFVNVSVTQDHTGQKEEQRLLSFPAKAMIFTNAKHQVVVYRDSCSFDIVQLQPVYQTQHTVMVKDGLKEGDKVVTENHLLIYNQIQN